jgi:dienelactone hydrolase
VARTALASGALLALLVVAFPSSPACGDPSPESVLHDAERPGPFPVGVTTCTFYDVKRPDAEGRPRGLKTEIWYPADDATRGLPTNRFSDFLDRGANPQLLALAGLALGAHPSEVDQRFRNTAVRDARWRDGRFPVLLFSHGNGSVRMQVAFWCEHMASHGYVVLAPDHTGNAVATTLGGRIVLADRGPQAIEQSRSARPADLSFLIDTLERLDRGDDSRFAGRLDLAKVGLAGHSFGAQSILSVSDSDSRVRAVSPWASARRTSRNDVPVLLLLAAEDVALTAEGTERCRQWFGTLSGPAHLVELRNGGHNSFTEMFQLDPERGDGVGTGTRVTDGRPLAYVPEEIAHRVVNGYTLAFFDRYLNGRTVRDDYLRVNPLPEELKVLTRPDGRR